MRTSDFHIKLNAKGLNEALNKKFGEKLNIDNYSIEQLEKAASLIENKINSFKNGKFNETLESEEFHRLKLMHDVVKTALSERAVSKSQQQAAGAALAAKRKGSTKGLKGASKDMAQMSTKELEKFAGTKHKGLPKKVGEGYGTDLSRGLSTASLVKKKTGRDVHFQMPQGHMIDTKSGKVITPNADAHAVPDLIQHAQNFNEGTKKKVKPDFLDVDKDRNKKEPMKKALKDKEKKVGESTGDYSAKKARAGKDIGKPGKQFAKIAAKAGERYGSEEKGKKVAGAVLAKLRAKESVNESYIAIGRFLSEGEEGKAELIMAVKDMVDKFTGWSEDIAQMQAQTAMEMADAIRDELGSDSAEQFASGVQPALDAAFQAVKGAREALNNQVGTLTGNAPEPMGAEPEAGAEGPDLTDMETEPGAEAGAEVGPEAGPEAPLEEPADRAKRESIERRMRLTKVLSSR